MQKYSQKWGELQAETVLCGRVMMRKHAEIAELTDGVLRIMPRGPDCREVMQGE